MYRKGLAFGCSLMCASFCFGQASRHADHSTHEPSQQVWLPGARSPSDIYGTRAIANAPREGERPEDQTGQEQLVPMWAPFGPSGADAESVSASPMVSGLLIAGVSSSVGGGAVYRSTNSGADWSLATGTGTTAINEVEFASSGVGWAATDNGLFRSTDNGLTWQPVTLPITGQVLVEDVAIDPTNASIIWVGIGQFLGGTSPVVTLKSVNNGATWDDISPLVTPGMGATVVAVDPANPMHIVAAFTPNFGGACELWTTTNGGSIWAERSSGLPNVPINDIAFGNGLVYVAGGQDFGSQFLGLYSSPDDGMSWNELSAAWPSRAATAVALDPSDPMKILVGTTRAGVVSTANGGGNWSYSVGGTGTYQVNDIEFVPGLPSNIFLGMGSIAVLRSVNGGSTFTAASNGMSRLELTSFAVNSLNTSEIAASYVGLNDGGIFVSTNAGQSWTLSQAPLPRWQKVYFAPNGTLYGTHDGPLGRADDGLWRRNANGSWTNLGPGVPTALDNIGLDIAATPGADPKILWSGYRWLNNFGAQVWTYNRMAPSAWEKEYEGPFSFEEVFSVLWLNGGAGPEALAGIVKFGSDGAGAVLRTTDSGDSWSPSPAGYPAGWNAWELARGPQSDGTVYVSSSANTGDAPAGIIKSIDGGLNWTQQGSNSTFRAFAVDPAAAGTLYGVSAFNNGRPVRSINDGASFELFDTGYMSQGGARDVVYGGSVMGTRRLYVATAAGGFATDLASTCGSADFNGDGDVGTDLDIEAFFGCLGGNCCETCGSADFDGNGDTGTDLDIEAFFRVLGGLGC